jgi:hypothetical protein
VTNSLWERDNLREPCTECGALVEPGEYHPFAFCVMRKAGLQPWHEVRVIAGQLGLGDPGRVPPKVWEVKERSRV